MPPYHRLLISVLCGLLAFPPRVAFADVPQSAPSALCESCQTEYVAGGLPKSVLVKVRVLGGASRPGTYYVPRGTDLLSLLTNAGGATVASEGWGYVKRHNGEKFTLLEFDIEDLVEDLGKPLEIKQDDLVYLPVNRPLTSDRTWKVILVVSGLAALLLTGLLVADRVK